MSPSNPEDPQVVEIRRYSNRRFYDTSASKHVTLEAIREIVHGGRDVRITDTSTGEDITARTLTQIILDYDDQKITAFPSAMLHRLIRSSESLLLDFIGQYFDNATQVFRDSQRSAEDQWRRMAGMTTMPQEAAHWFQGTMDDATTQQANAGSGRDALTPGTPSADLERVVEDLRNRLENVQAELKEFQEKSAGEAEKGDTPPPKRKSSGRKRK